MLIGSGRVAIPGIVRDVQDEAGGGVSDGDLIGENDLVADQGQEGGCACKRHRPARSTGGKAAGHLDEIGDTPAFENVLERQIFAEGHKMQLVGRFDDRALIVDHIDRVVEARASRLRALHPHRAADQRLARLERIGQTVEGIRPVGQNEGKGGLGPDDQRAPVRPAHRHPAPGAWP